MFQISQSFLIPLKAQFYNQKSLNFLDKNRNFDKKIKLSKLIFKGIPGQEIIYANGSSEDAIIARCWRMFIDNYNNGLIDHGVLVQNAMAKAAVRALDSVTELVYRTTGNYPIRAGVTGADKPELKLVRHVPNNFPC